MLAQREERFAGPLTVDRTRYGDDVVVFSLSGELDLAAVEMASEVIGPALAEPGAMVVVDLTELEFIDVKGIALLHELAGARPQEDSLRLLPSRHRGVAKVLRLTGVRTTVSTVAP